MRVDQPDVQLIMPPKLLPAAHHTWLESCKNVRISALHRDVARVLTEYGIPHNIEHVTEDELFSVDIALPGMCLIHHVPFFVGHLEIYYVINLLIYY